MKNNMGGHGSGQKKSRVTVPNRGAEAMRVYQKRRRMNDAALAEIVGVSAAAINRYTHGVSRPSIEHAFAIEDATGGAVAARWWIEHPTKPKRKI